jgi:hypothetical protein
MFDQYLQAPAKNIRWGQVSYHTLLVLSQNLFGLFVVQIGVGGVLLYRTI